MLALWAVFLLSALVISWALDIDSRLAVSGEGTRMLKAEAAACSGAEVALHPVVNPGSPNLSRQVGEAKYEARLTGEGGRLHLNYLAGGAVREAGAALLKQYLQNKGIDLNERDLMVDSLQDWIQLSTGIHRLNAPPESDTYHPPHQPLNRVEELKQVAGWADFTSQPGWDEDFTVNSRGPVDLNWASRDVLLALFGSDRTNMVDRFLQLRQGTDGVDGTEDDVHFKSSVEAAGAFPGLRPDQLQTLEQAGLITFTSNIFRVTSVGTSRRATRTVQVVFMKAQQPSVITWKEF